MLGNLFDLKQNSKVGSWGAGRTKARENHAALIDRSYLDTLFNF
jgi:hypothetical protein